MQSKEYILPNGKTAVFEYDVCGIGKVTLECMDELMGMIADRPQGKWLMGNRPLEGKFRIFRCSVCGYEPLYKGEPITPTNMTLLYCPHCGADMRKRGVDDE